MHAANLASYRNAVAKSFVPLRITPDRNYPFFANLRTAGSGNVVFTEVSSTPQLVERTPSMIERGGSSYYKVSLLLSGTSILVQDGRELVMRPGDLSVYDTSRPYSLLFEAGFRNLIMMFPKSSLNCPAPSAEQFTAVSLNEENPLAPILAGLISRFPQQLSTLPAPVRAKLANTSLDLVSTLFSSILGIDETRTEPHQVLQQQIREYIDANLASPGLTPGSVAAAHFISTRHLHALFSTAESTVAALIKERRLERCRLDLIDPAQGPRGVAEIAARWGFVDAAHFSRIFRATYGLSPTEFRRGHQESPRP